MRKKTKHHFVQHFGDSKNYGGVSYAKHIADTCYVTFKNS